MATMARPAVRTSRPLATRDPFREFDNLFGRFAPAAWSPPADVVETAEDYVVELEVPGARRDDVTVDLDGDALTISGEVKKKEREGWFRHRTRRVGEFRYRVVLPREVDQDGIAAELAEGVLTVRVPKSSAAKPRRIEIEGK